jgi:hypothetical protein
MSTRSNGRVAMAATSQTLALFVVATLMCLSGCQAAPRVSSTRIFYTSNTYAYTDPCGCCSGQSGGLAVRATYLVQQAARMSSHESSSVTEANSRTAPDEGTGGEGDAGSSWGDTHPQNETTVQKAVVSLSKPRPPSDFVLFDCGSFVDVSSTSKIMQSVFTSSAMAEMAYDVVNIGLREVECPPDELGKILKPLSDCVVVSANAHFSKNKDGHDSSLLRSRIKPYTRLKVGGQRLFVTGVTSQASVAHNIMAGLGVIIDDPATAVRDTCAFAKHDEVVIVLANGLTDKEGYAVAKLPGIDVVIGLRSPEALATHSGVPYILPNVADRGRELGSAILFGTKPSLVCNSVGQVRLLTEMPKHKLIEAQLEQLSGQITEAELKEQRKLDLIQHDQVIDYLGSAACAQCHPGEYSDFTKSKHFSALETLKAKHEERNALCLSCHTTGYGTPTGFVMARPVMSLRQVGCESCHGPGEVHRELKLKKEITGPLQGVDGQGLKPVQPTTCQVCHTPETSSKFNYDLFVTRVNHSALLSQRKSGAKP